MEKETKAVAYSKVRKYAEKMIDILKGEGIEATLDNYLANYIIYVAKDAYDEALAVARKKGNENQIGMLNDYAEFRGLLATSLAYVELRDHKDIDKAWEYGDRKPSYVAALLKDISSIVPSAPYIVVNGADGSIEILINSKDNDKHEEWVKKIVALVEEKHSKYFKRCTPCKATGLVLCKKEEKEELPYEDIFFASMFMDGMIYPMGSNVAPKSDCENHLEEDGYWISQHSFGGQDLKLESSEEGKLTGSLELYEKMEFSSQWDAENKRSISIPRTESTVVDNVDFTSTVEVLDENECTITTTFELKRKVEVFPKNMASNKYPTDKSVRNGMFAYPLENGEYSGTYTERFVKIANGTRLLHFSEQSPFFEVFEIDEDFDFANPSMSEYPKVFDDTTFDKDDKDINEMMKYLGADAKKLILEQK